MDWSIPPFLLFIYELKRRRLQPLSDCYISKRRGHERPQGNLDAAYVALQLGDEVSINMKHQPPPAIA